MSRLLSRESCCGLMRRSLGIEHDELERGVLNREPCRFRLLACTCGSARVEKCRDDRPAASSCEQ